MRACKSDNDHLLKVRYLSEKGAECLMTDEVRFAVNLGRNQRFVYLGRNDGLVLCHQLLFSS